MNKDSVDSTGWLLEKRDLPIISHDCNVDKDNRFSVDTLELDFCCNLITEMVQFPQ